MTMDVASEAQINLKISSSHLDESNVQIKPLNEVQTKLPIKRSFDVAFLMMPDEKLKQKEKIQLQQELHYPLTELTVRSDLTNRNSHPLTKIGNKVFLNSDYSAVFKSCEDQYSTRSLTSSTVSSDKSDESIEIELPRSAFSKVAINVDSPIPPAASPDQLSCSSASPPISYSPPSANFRSDYGQLINSSAFHAISQQSFGSPKQQKALFYRNSSLSPAATLVNNNNNNNNNNNSHSPTGTTDSSYFHPFQQFGPNIPHVFMQQQDQFMRNPAAAILSTLMPTSIGSLSLPAQNVCAKCNISFRMTSDLVYHMRSHHKNENVQDPNRRKREEKLKCPVCSESFRERHHLTRHMTAHQDKEGDLIEHEISEYHARRK